MSREDRLGALWLSQSKSERAPFAKGTIENNGEKIPVVVWANRWKAEDLADPDPTKREAAHKKPDYYIERDQPRERVEEPPRPRREVPERARAMTETADEFADDIPF